MINFFLLKEKSVSIRIGQDIWFLPYAEFYYLLKTGIYVKIALKFMFYKQHILTFEWKGLSSQNHSKR